MQLIPCIMFLIHIASLNSKKNPSPLDLSIYALLNRKQQKNQIIVPEKYTLTPCNFKDDHTKNGTKENTL